jgi:hypothetical protein
MVLTWLFFQTRANHMGVNLLCARECELTWQDVPKLFHVEIFWFMPHTMLTPAIQASSPCAQRLPCATQAQFGSASENSGTVSVARKGADESNNNIESETHRCLFMSFLHVAKSCLNNQFKEDL